MLDTSVEQMHPAQLSGDERGKMSDTSRTDFEAVSGDSLLVGEDAYYVEADFCKTLERELNAMTAERDALKLCAESVAKMASKLRDERDALKAELTRVREVAGTAMQNYETAVMDLHRAKAELAKLRENIIELADKYYSEKLFYKPLRFLLDYAKECKAPEVKP